VKRFLPALIAVVLAAAPDAVRAQMSRDELGTRIAAEATALGSLAYNARWTPPGEPSAWPMDCSNTVRWLYRTAAGLDLPRTASDQYLWLKARGRLWRVSADHPRWTTRLRPGDLLFWENTYRPKRRPPVTHVMIYTGRGPDGSLRMVGSQGSRGIDTYTFRPGAEYGGYTWFLWFRRPGKFVAFGRPL
jgi:cell wall-associated NlpC family hydrolase